MILGKKSFGSRFECFFLVCFLIIFKKREFKEVGLYLSMGRERKGGRSGGFFFKGFKGVN